MLELYMKWKNKALTFIFIYVIWKANMRCLDKGLTIITCNKNYIGSPLPAFPLQGDGKEPDRSYVYTQGDSYTTEEEAQI